MPTVLQAQLNDSDTFLNSFHDTVIVRVLVNQREPNIMVIGKVVIGNNVETRRTQPFA
jgi:hypothetical protein